MKDTQADKATTHILGFFIKGMEPLGQFFWAFQFVLPTTISMKL